MNKKKLFIAMSIAFAIGSSVEAFGDDLVIYDENAETEIGLIFNQSNPGGWNTQNLPSFRENSQQTGINTSATSFVMQTKNQADAWNSYVLLQIDKGGITPEMIQERPYLKIMVHKNPNVQNIALYLQTQNAKLPDWNIWAKAVYYGGPGSENTWVDMVIDLRKNRTNINYEDSTITAFRFLPITQHGAKPPIVTFRIDQIVLSDNSMPRDLQIMEQSNVQFLFEDYETEKSTWLKDQEINPQNTSNTFAVVDNPLASGINTSEKVLEFNKIDQCTWYHGGPMFRFNDLVVLDDTYKYMHCMIYVPEDGTTTENPTVQLHSADWTGNVNQRMDEFVIKKGKWIDMVQEVNKDNNIPYLRQFSVRFDVRNSNGDYINSAAAIFYIDNIMLNDNPNPIIETTGPGTNINRQEMKPMICYADGWLKANNISSDMYIYDLTGSMIKVVKTQNGQCNILLSLPQGVYIIKAQQQTHKITIR